MVLCCIYNCCIYNGTIYVPLGHEGERRKEGGRALIVKLQLRFIDCLSLHFFL